MVHACRTARYRLRGPLLPSELPKFLLKVSAGEFDLPLVRAELSRKGAKGVHLADLAAYLDKQRETARFAGDAS
jgi:hypothetical protein